MESDWASAPRPSRVARGKGGFVPQAKRWRVEQTYGILVLHRRLVCAHEYHPASSASRVHWAMRDRLFPYAEAEHRDGARLGVAERFQVDPAQA